jgi:hypothetical protein
LSRSDGDGLAAGTRRALPCLSLSGRDFVVVVKLHNLDPRQRINPTKFAHAFDYGPNFQSLVVIGFIGPILILDQGERLRLQG